MKLGFTFWWYLICSYLMMWMIGYVMGDKDGSIWLFMFFFIIHVLFMLSEINKRFQYQKGEILFEQIIKNDKGNYD